PSIPLRRVVRLRTLADVRPAREALAARGIAAEPLAGVPAVITSGAERGRPGRFEALLAEQGVHAESVIGLWEDLAPRTLSPVGTAGSSAPTRQTHGAPAS
ncbi:MAG: hypothetical protein ACLPYS_14810, partial [Vulcanimicrobiaceae bacterium]